MASWVGKLHDWPSFLTEVMVRKRKWRQGTFEVSTETVKYLCPAPEEHGHWILPKDEPPRVTKLLMKPALHPISEERWMALEKQTVDALVVRRRMREKSAIRRLEETEEKEKEENEDVKRKVNLLRVVEQEMRLMVEDDTELAVEEMKIIAKLKKMAGFLKFQVRRKRFSRHALCRQKRSPKRGKNGLTQLEPKLNRCSMKSRPSERSSLRSFKRSKNRLRNPAVTSSTSLQSSCSQRSQAHQEAERRCGG